LYNLFVCWERKGLGIFKKNSMRDWKDPSNLVNLLGLMAYTSIFFLNNFQCFDELIPGLFLLYESNNQKDGKPCILSFSSLLSFIHPSSNLFFMTNKPLIKWDHFLLVFQWSSPFYMGTCAHNNHPIDKNWMETFNLV